MKKCDLSIIIPIYNVEKYLRQCLDSVIGQTLKDIEIICVNDCSSDDSLKIIKEYAKKDNRIKVIDLKENSGQGIARNKAVEIATGKFITFLDSDDYIQKNGYELALKKASSKTDVILFGFESFNEDEKLNKLTDRFNIYYNKNLDLFLDEKKRCDFSNIVISNLIPVSPCKIYRLDFIKDNKISFINGKYIHEDEGWFLKWLSNEPYIVSIKDEIYKRRVRKDSIMGNVNFNKAYLAKSKKHKKIVRKDAKKYIKINNKEKWNNLTKKIRNSKIRKISVRLACFFIPFKHKRKMLREKYIY